MYIVHCTVGWVNLYQKFEIEKYTVCGKLILPKKNGKAFFFHNWLEFLTLKLVLNSFQTFAKM